MEQTRISSSPSQAAHEARGAAGKAGTAQDGAQAAAQGDGFALLLAALGAGDGGTVVADTLSAAAADEAPRPVEWLRPVGGVPDAGALAAWMAGLQPGAALAQAAGDARAGEVDALTGRLGLGLVRPGQDTLVGQTALLDGAAEQAALQGTPPAGPTTTAMGRGAALRASGAALQGAAREIAGLAADTPGAQAGRSGQPHAAGVVAHLPVPATAVAGGGAGERRDPAQAAGAPVPVQPGEWAAAQGAGTSMGGAAAVAAGGASAPAGPRAGDAAAGVPGLEPQPPTAAEPGFGPADAAQAGLAGDEQLADQLAEQVAYWVHHKTQNAELTLDRDGRPVEVKVALTGEQAHVTFRSDQAEARQLLDTGAAQLREMLQQEGLQLAGVTVGTTGGDGPPAREGSREGGRRDARQASVQAAAPADVAARGRGVTERSVDIFV